MGPGHPRIARDPRSPGPPAAPSCRARSGRVAFGRFVRGPMAHSHVATPVAEQRVDLAIVDDGADQLTDEEDVIADGALVDDATPQHRDAAVDGRSFEIRLVGDGDLQGSELVGSLPRPTCGNSQLLLCVMEKRNT